MVSPSQPRPAVNHRTSTSVDLPPGGERVSSGFWSHHEVAALGPKLGYFITSRTGDPHRLPLHFGKTARSNRKSQRQTRISARTKKARAARPSLSRAASKRCCTRKRRRSVPPQGVPTPSLCPPRPSRCAQWEAGNGPRRPAATAPARAGRRPAVAKAAAAPRCRTRRAALPGQRRRQSPFGPGRPGRRRRRRDREKCFRSSSSTFRDSRPC